MGRGEYMYHEIYKWILISGPDTVEWTEKEVLLLFPLLPPNDV